MPVMITLGEKLTLDEIECAFSETNTSSLATIPEHKLDDILHSRSFLEDQINQGQVMYGVNTGFGRLANTSILPEQIEQLQLNLIRSHAAGSGPIIPFEITRLALVLLANSLSKGFSGVRALLVKKLEEIINSNIVPVAYQYGSLGASGDLAPLAHVVLAILNEGPVMDRQGNVFEKMGDAVPGYEPVALTAKEGLALINGTHFSLSYLISSIRLAKLLFKTAIVVSALSFEALHGLLPALDPLIHSIRPHPGQVQVAQAMDSLIKDSELVYHTPRENKHSKVQDAYSVRCTPQIMGGIYYAITNAMQIAEIELNSVTDNPLIFSKEGKVISGGNFHGEPLALSSEYLSLGLAKLSSLSQVRTEKLLNPNYNFGLPAFLVQSPGLNSGFMIAHYTQASMLNRIRVLSAPAATDNIPVSAQQEDLISNSMTSASKCYEIAKLAQEIVSIELLVSAQAFELREQISQKQGSPILRQVVKVIRRHVPILENDRIIHKDIKNIVKLVESGGIVNLVEEVLGKPLVTFDR